MDLTSYGVEDFPYKSSFDTDWESLDTLEKFNNAKDFVEVYFYGVIYDLIPRMNVPEPIKEKKQQIFISNALAWYMTDFYGSEMGATAPTTGLMPIAQKNIGGVFIGFAQTKTQEALKALESNKFGIVCRDIFLSCKERYAIYR